MNELKKNSMISLKSVFILIFFLFSFPYPASVKAEEDLSIVSYQYRDIGTLTDKEKSRIIKGIPTEIISNDFENYIFVYESKQIDIITPITKNKILDRLHLVEQKR